MGTEQSKKSSRVSMAEIDSQVLHVSARFNKIFIDVDGNVSIDKLRQFLPALTLIMKANLEEVNMELLGENILDDIGNSESLYQWCKELINWDLDLVAVVNKALCQYAPDSLLAGDIVLVNQGGDPFEAMVVHDIGDHSQYEIRSLVDGSTQTVSSDICVHTARFSTELDVHYKISDEVKAQHEGQWDTAVVLEDLGYVTTEPTKAAAEAAAHQEARRARIDAAFERARTAQELRIKTRRREVQQLTKIYIVQRMPQDGKKFTDLRRSVSPSGAGDTYFRRRRRVANDARVRVLQTVETDTEPYVEIQVISDPAVTGFLKKRYVHLLPDEVHILQHNKLKVIGLRKYPTTLEHKSVYFKPRRKIKNGERVQQLGVEQSEDGVSFSLIRQITNHDMTGYVHTEYLKVNRMLSDNLAPSSVPTMQTAPEDAPEVVARDAAQREAKLVDAEQRRRNRHKQLAARVYRVKFLDTDEEKCIPGFKLKMPESQNERKETGKSKREQRKKKLRKKLRRRNAVFRNGSKLAAAEEELSSTTSNHLMVTKFDLAAKIYFALDRNHDGMIDLDEIRVLAAAVQDMDGVTLENDFEESLANGDFDPILGSEGMRLFFAKQGFNILQMDTLLEKLAAHAPRDFVVGDHVLTDVRSKARQAVVLGSEGEGLIRVRVLKDNSVATVPRSSCERAGYFEILGIDAEDGEWVQALVKGKWSDGQIVGPAAEDPEDASDVQSSKYRVLLEKTEAEVTVAGTDIRYPAMPTLESLRAQFDLALRIFNILDRKHTGQISAESAEKFMHLLSDIAETDAQVDFEQPDVAPRTFNGFRDLFLGSNMDPDFLEKVFDSLVGSYKDFAPGDYVRADRHKKISKAKVLGTVPESSLLQLRFLGSDKIRAVPVEALKHTGEYEDMSAELQQGAPVRVVHNNRWVDGVVMSTDDQHLWDEVYKQMSTRSSDEDDDVDTKNSKPLEQRYRVWHSGQASLFNQYSIQPDYWRENELVKGDARDSRHELVESIFDLIDTENGGKVPYKEVMNVKATVARMSARKPSVRDNAWRLQLADRKLDHYELDDFKLFCAAMKWEDDVLTSLLDTLEGGDVSPSDWNSEMLLPTSPGTPALLVPLPRDKDEQEVELERQVENLRSQIDTTNKNAVACATMASGMIEDTLDVQPVDAADAARDLQRRVARWITRKKLSQLKKDGAARQRGSASIQANNNAKLERFREFCQAPVVLAMQDKYEAHRLVVAAIRDEIDPSGTDAQAILRAFRRIDLNNNKLITTTELRLALSEYGLELGDEAFSCIAREFDSENSGTISYNNFLGFFKSRRHETLEMQTEHELAFWTLLKSVHQDLREEHTEQAEAPVAFPGTSKSWRVSQLQNRVAVLQDKLHTARRANDQIQATAVHLMRTNMRAETPVATPLPGTPLPTPIPTPAPNGHQYGSNNPLSAIDETEEDDLDDLGWGWNSDVEALPTLATPTDLSEAARNDPADPHKLSESKFSHSSEPEIFHSNEPEIFHSSESKLSQPTESKLEDVPTNAGTPQTRTPMDAGKLQSRTRAKTSQELGLEAEIEKMTAEMDERNRSSLRIISMSGGLLDRAKESYDSFTMNLDDSVQALAELQLFDMFLDDRLEPRTVKSEQKSNLPPDMVLETSDTDSGFDLKSRGPKFSRLSRDLKNGLTNLMGIFDGTIYERLKPVMDKVKPVKTVVGDRATLAVELRDIEMVNSSSTAELVQLADRISEEGVRAARARKSRVARMFSSAYVPDLQALRAAFGSIHEMHSVNEQLLGEVEALVKDWKGDTCLGPVLLKYAPALQCYSTYCANVGPAVAMIDTLMKPEKELTKTELKTKMFFQHAVNEVWGKGTELPAVRGLVLAPSQHIPRLRRVSQSILNATGGDHKDEKAMREAVEALKQTERVINQMMGALVQTDEPSSGPINELAKLDHKNKIPEPKNKAHKQKQEEMLARARALILPALAEYEKHETTLSQVKDRVTQANTDGKLLTNLQTHFRKKDTNNQGTVPLRTLKEGLTRHGVYLTDEQVKVIRNEFDPHDDGAVPYNAFLKACADQKGSAGAAAQRQRRIAFLRRIRERERVKRRQKLKELKAPVDVNAIANAKDRVRILQMRAAALKLELAQMKAAGETIAAMSMADEDMVQRSLRMEKLLSTGESSPEAKEANVSSQAAARITLMKMIQELRNDLKATANIGNAEADRSHPKGGNKAKAANKALVEHRNALGKNYTQSDNGTQTRQQQQVVASSLTQDKNGKLRMRMLVSQQSRSAAASNGIRSGVQARVAVASGETASGRTDERHLYGDNSAEASNGDDKDKDKRCCNDVCCNNCFLS